MPSSPSEFSHRSHHSVPSRTSSRRSAYSSRPNTPEFDIPTRRELNSIVRDRNFEPFLSHAFQPGHIATSELCHFISLSNTIQRIEFDLRNYLEEQEHIYISLEDNRTFQQLIEPIHRYYQQTHPSRRTHPYRRPTRITHSTTSSNEAQEVTILDMDIPPLASSSGRNTVATPDNVNPSDIPLPPSPPTTTTPSTSSSTSDYRTASERQLELGTQEFPIVIEDFDEAWRCARCNQEGHDEEDCDAQIPVPPPCPICQWSRQLVCDHYQITPAWTQQQQRIIARRS